MIGTLLPGQLAQIVSTVSPPISGYALWLDAADDNVFTYSSGSLVSQWNDKSGNARNFTQSTVGNQPTRTNNLQNSKPGVVFRSGTGSANRWLTATYDWAGSAFTAFIVVKNGTTGTDYQVAFGQNISQGLSMAFTNSDYYALFRNGVQPFTTNLTTTNSNADVAVWKGAGLSGGSITTAFYKNGTAGTSITASSITSSTTASVGAANSTESVTGWINEVLIYPSQLSDSDRNSVESYLKTKWGTP